MILFVYFHISHFRYALGRTSIHQSDTLSYHDPKSYKFLVTLPICLFSHMSFPLRLRPDVHPVSKGVHNGASYVASLHGSERQKQRLFYTFLFFYILLDSYVPLSDS
jgi:hypothetical protein